MLLTVVVPVFNEEATVLALLARVRQAPLPDGIRLEIVADSGGYAEGIRGAGHWLMETHAELVNDKLKHWFKD